MVLAAGLSLIARIRSATRVPLKSLHPSSKWVGDAEFRDPPVSHSLLIGRLARLQTSACVILQPQALRIREFAPRAATKTEGGGPTSPFKSEQSWCGDGEGLAFLARKYDYGFH